MIDYAGSAYGTFQRHVADIAGYTVELTIPSPATGESVTFDATILGPDLDAEDGFTVRYRGLNEKGEAVGPELSSIAERIYVY